MSLANRRWNARRDANEAELVKAFLKLGGAIWVPTGPLDGWASVAGRWMPVEIKMPHREGHKDEFTEAERAFMTECAMSGQPYQIWRTQDDVVQLVNGARGGKVVVEVGQ